MLLVIGAVSLNVGCGGEVSAEATQVRAADGTTTTTITAKVSVKFLRPETPIPQYEVVFQEYPFNRLLLRATTLYPYGLNYNDSERPVTVPMDLPTADCSATVTIGSWQATYTVTPTKVSTMPAGTYLMDSPGMMEDVVLAAKACPGYPVRVVFSGSNGGTLQPLYPTYSSETSTTLPRSLGITIPGDQTWMIGNLKTVRPTLIKSINYLSYE